MEVLFVSHKHPPGIGGIQAQNKALVDGMSRHARVHRLIWDQREPLPAFLASVPLRVARCCLDVVLPIEAYRRWVVERFNAFDAVVAVSRETARTCVARGIAPGKLHVVHNGIDPRFAASQRDPGFRARLEQRLGGSLAGRRILVHTGRAVRRKGLSWFLERVLPRLDQDVVFLMIGPRDARFTGRLERALRLLPRARAELAQRARAHTLAHDTREQMVLGYLRLFQQLSATRMRRASAA